MANTLTEEQKKRMRGIAVSSFFLGTGITFLIMHIINKKQVDKLEAKIFKLEGWQ